MTHFPNSTPGRRAPNWGAAVGAGLVAGLVFMILEMMLVPLLGGGSAWGPPRMIAAIVLGPDVLPGQGVAPTFEAGVILTAMIVHFAVSVVLAVIFALIVSWRPMSMGAAIALGLAFGLVVYLVNFYLLTAVFPWFAMARNWITIFSHLMFGLVLAWSYLAMARR